MKYDAHYATYPPCVEMDVARFCDLVERGGRAVLANRFRRQIPLKPYGLVGGRDVVNNLLPFHFLRMGKRLHVHREACDDVDLLGMTEANYASLGLKRRHVANALNLWGEL